MSISKKFTNLFERNELRAQTAVQQQSTLTDQKRKRGRVRIDYPPTQTTTIEDIREFAFIYECEGNININQTQIEINIGQNDREILDRIQPKFGGKVYGPYTNATGNDTHMLKIVRERALGIMFTIFSLLSRARKDQFKAVLSGQVIKRVYQQTISDKGISEAFLKRNLIRNSKKQNELRNHPMGMFGVKK